MFKFTIKYLGFLKHFPLLPFLFEGILLISTAIFNKKIMKMMEEIEEEVKSWEGTTTSLHKYGGIQFNYHTKELGHIHGNGQLDILLPISMTKALINKAIVGEHHSFKNTGWASLYIREKADKETAIWLLKLSKDFRIKKCHEN